MNRVKYLFLFSLLFVIHISGRGLNEYHWRKLFVIPNSSGQAVFVSGKSEKDFYVKTAEGKLLHIYNGKIERTISPPLNDFIGIYYFAISANDFFCSVVTKKMGRRDLQNNKGEVEKIWDTT